MGGFLFRACTGVCDDSQARGPRRRCPYELEPIFNILDSSAILTVDMGSFIELDIMGPSKILT